ncbi:hypothetical protein GCM10007169_06940 [Shewanella fodinae]|nr:hypothetical protein GCM10007169_06940 [Shewanella fodinae]
MNRVLKQVQNASAITMFLLRILLNLKSFIMSFQVIIDEIAEVTDIVKNN